MSDATFNGIVADEVVRLRRELAIARADLEVALGVVAAVGLMHDPGHDSRAACAQAFFMFEAWEKHRKLDPNERVKRATPWARGEP